MSAELHCSQELLLQADFDGELDAAESAALQAHLASCAICGPALSRLQRSRSLLARAPRPAAPNRLRDSVRQLARSQPRGAGARTPSGQSFATKLAYAVSGAGAGAVAAGVLAFLLFGARPSYVAETVIDNHLRALQSPAHLVDVASSEHHTVKPWFAGQIDFAPPVKDLATFGYPLRGGRVDVVDGRNAAVLVYQAGAHTIDVSIQPRPAGGFGSAPAERRGFNLRRFEDGDFSVWAVSDLNARELDTFVERWKAAE
jgi:anti-sigma factor RsiW